MYKLIAVDLDGTLLNSYGNVSEEDKKAVKEAIENNCEVILTSGRVTESVQNIAKEIGADHYLVSGNGSTIYDFSNDNIIYDKYIEKKKILQIIKLCEENSIYYNLYTDQTIIAKSLQYNVLFYHSENSRKPEGKKTSINIVEDIYGYIQNQKDPKVSKVTICDDSNIIFPRILEKVKVIRNIDVLDVAHMSRKIIKSGTQDVDITYYYSEVSSKNVNKWTALEYLMQQLNIKQEEVIAIGDNVNDKTMIQNAGLGVAMENSAPYIKEIADYVTTDNNSSGVAQVIKKYVIN